MDLSALRTKIMKHPISASDGNHSARLERVLDNIQNNARANVQDDRLIHLMSRVGVLTRTLARDLRSGFISQEDAATILEQIAELGDICFDNWRNSD